MKETLTILQAVEWAVRHLRQNQVLHPRFSAMSLVAHALGIDPLNLHLRFNRALKTGELKRIQGYLRRRCGHEPLEYILGEAYFFGLPFKVSPAVLRPRPETGQLVEMALGHLSKAPKERRLVLDLGTGCGNIAVTIAKYLPCRIWAVDISGPALAAAKANARRLGVANSLNWRRGSWFSALKPSDPAQFEVIVCNPPYIASPARELLNPEIAWHEPPVAIYGGKTGLEPYRTMARGLAQRLAPGGMALMELEPNRAQRVSAFFKGRELKRSFGRDDAGVNRVLVLKKSGDSTGIK